MDTLRLSEAKPLGAPLDPTYTRSLRPGGAAPPAVPRRRLTLLPTLNEEEGLAATLEQYAAVSSDWPECPRSVLVVDGHSTDGTLRVAERWGTEFIIQSGHGKGAAIREGLQWALEREFDEVAVLDADGTYPCESLPAMFDLLESGSDLVVGVRRPDPRPSLRDVVHRCGNWLLNSAAATLARSPILDVCSGFWGIRTHLASEIPLESNGFDIEAELFVRAFRSGHRVSQLPIDYRPRVGEAKLHAVRDGVRILKAIVKHSHRRVSSSGRRGGVPSMSLDSGAMGFRTLLISLAPQRLILLSGPNRADEAKEVASEFARARPEAEVMSVVTTAPERYVREHPASLLPFAGGSARDAPVVVILPPDSYARPGDGRWLVAVPGTRRIFQLGNAPADQDSTRPPTASRLSGPARSPLPLLGTLANLWSYFDPAGHRQVLRFVGANVPEAPILDASRRSATTTSPGSRLEPDTEGPGTPSGSTHPAEWIRVRRAARPSPLPRS